MGNANQLTGGCYNVVVHEQASSLQTSSKQTLYKNNTDAHMLSLTKLIKGSMVQL